jgi:hypothetical protein
MLPTPYPPQSTRPAADNPSSSTDDSTATCGTPPPSLSHLAARNGTLGEKFEFMLECTQAVGSDNFDSLAITYYTGKFGASTPLANEQRLSRNRGLPKLIGEVHQAAKEWSDWERRGFYDEIFKTTELCLMTELERARQPFREVLAPLLATQDSANGNAEGGADGPSVVSMKRVIEDEVSKVLYSQHLKPCWKQTWNCGIDRFAVTECLGAADGAVGFVGRERCVAAEPVEYGPGGDCYIALRRPRAE